MRCYRCNRQRCATRTVELNGPLFTRTAVWQTNVLEKNLRVTIGKTCWFWMLYLNLEINPVFVLHQPASIAVIHRHHSTMPHPPSASAPAIPCHPTATPGSAFQRWLPVFASSSGSPSGAEPVIRPMWRGSAPGIPGSSAPVSSEQLSTRGWFTQGSDG